MSAHSDYSESPFELESILPSQFFEGRNKNEALEPIKRLMLAVLTDAVRGYQVGADAQKILRRRAFREAEEWLFRTISDGPFSFENVCCTLGIAPNYLRDALHKWRARRVRGARVAAVRRSPVVMSVRQTTTAIRGGPRCVVNQE
jgi:hypothetical protein